MKHFFRLKLNLISTFIMNFFKNSRVEMSKKNLIKKCQVNINYGLNTVIINEHHFFFFFFLKINIFIFKSKFLKIILCHSIY